MTDRIHDAEYESLVQLGRATRYNRWMFSRLAPHLGRRVLEIGSGIGNLTRYLEGRELVVATDVEPRYLRVLSETFAGRGVDVRPLDLGAFDPGELACYRLDTIVCLNVLEHVEDDAGALARLRAALAPGGRLVVLVPAHPGLYGALDRAVGHWRRYRRAELVERLGGAGFAVQHVSFFNRLGVPGWWLNTVLLQRARIPAFQLRIQNALVPLLRAEAALPLPFGLSLIAVGARR